MAYAFPDTGHNLGGPLNQKGLWRGDASVCPSSGDTRTSGLWKSVSLCMVPCHLGGGSCPASSITSLFDSLALLNLALS